MGNVLINLDLFSYNCRNNTYSEKEPIDGDGGRYCPLVWVGMEGKFNNHLLTDRRKFNGDDDVQVFILMRGRA